jgi:tetratricopeptide (TPR) repeat protein
MHVIGEWIFDPHSRYLSSDSAKHRLSPKAAHVLLNLLHEPGRVWTRAELLDAAWPEQTVGEEVLTQVVAELRRALRDNFRQPRYLETVHKTGYRLLVGPDNDMRAGAGPGGWAADLEAYGIYLQGLAFREGGGLSGLTSAIELYSTALRVNPRLAVAHVGMSEALLFTDYAEPIDVPRVRSHCHAALGLDNAMAEAWSVDAIACAIRGDFAAATDLIRRALALGPGSAAVHYQAARLCMSAMALQPAADMLERAARLAPLDPFPLVLAGKIRAMLGHRPASVRNHVAALPRLEAHIATYPDDFRGQVSRARCLQALGRREEAAVDMDLARRHAEPMPFHLACTLAQNGWTDVALEALERAVDLGWRGPWARPWLDLDTDFDGVRSDPRFTRITAQLAAPA